MAHPNLMHDDEIFARNSRHGDLADWLDTDEERAALADPEHPRYRTVYQKAYMRKRRSLDAAADMAAEEAAAQSAAEAPRERRAPKRRVYSRHKDLERFLETEEERIILFDKDHPRHREVYHRAWHAKSGTSPVARGQFCRTIPQPYLDVCPQELIEHIAALTPGTYRFTLAYRQAWYHYQKATRPDFLHGYYVKNIKQNIIENAKKRLKKKHGDTWREHLRITAEDLPDVPDLCPILEIPIYVTPGRVTDHSPTLDRIDPRLPYQPGNIQIISHRANRLKGDFDEAEHRKAIRFHKRRKAEMKRASAASE